MVKGPPVLLMVAKSASRIVLRETKSERSYQVERSTQNTEQASPLRGGVALLSPKQLERQNSLSTQQIPTFTQLSAARKILWHQGTAPGNTATSRVELADSDVAQAGSVETSVDEGEQVTESAVGKDETAEVEVDRMGAGEAFDEGVDEAEAAQDPDEDEDASYAEATDEDGEEQDGGEADDAGEDEVAAAPASAAVRTIEAARELIERAGLMPFVPHAALSAAPSPSFVEATLGEANAAPTLAESATARSLLARLVAEGTAVPLNLLGQPGTTGEAPDFVVSTNAFSYIFTLRGDKGWKQLPETSGANKVSPLAVNTYGLLVEGGPQSAYTLTGELGKGLTEAAVLRALNELWQQLRVVPVAQPNGKPTVWEPITTRLMRQIKAGANAGQPTALSALVSLYLGQVLLATEDEIEVFLSTVAPRSRVRDVVHALMAAQQLESMAVAGKQNVYLVGELPDFDAPEAAAETPRAPGPMLAGDGSRIRRMVKSTRPDGERAKPFRAGGSGGFAGRPAFGGARGARPGASAGDASAGGFAGRGDRGGKPAFARDGGVGRPDRVGKPGPRFDRPWDETKRPSRPAGEETGPGDAGAQSPSDSRRPGNRGGGEFRAQGDRPERRGGERPAFGRRDGGSGDRSQGGFDRPRPRPSIDGGASDRPSSSRPSFDRPNRPSFDRSSAGGDRPRFGAARPGGFGGRGAGGGPRRDAQAGGGGGFSGPRDGGGEGRPPRSSARDDRGGGRPQGGFGDGGRSQGGFGGPRPGSAGGGRSGGVSGGAGSRFGGGARSGEFRPGGARFGGPRPGGPRPGAPRPGAPRSEGESPREERPAFRKFDAPRDGDRPFRPARRPEGEGGARGSGGGDRPSRPAGERGFTPRPGAARDGAARPFRPAGGSRFAAGAAGDSRGPKRPFAKREGAGVPRAGASRGGDAPGAGPFDKFKDGNKPWGKRPPKRKIKPEGGEG